MGRKFNSQLISGGTEQVFKNKANALLDADYNGERGQLRWMLLMEILKKYTNLGKFTDDDLEKQKGAIFSRLFWNGQCGVVYAGGMPYCVSYTELKKSIDGYPLSAKIESYNGVSRNETKFPIDTLTRENGAFLKANFYSWPLFMGLDTYLKPLLEIWPLLDAEITNAIVKVIIRGAPEGKERDTMMRELQRAFSREGKLWAVVPGKFGEITELKTETINDKLWEHIKTSINFMNQRLGFLYNASEKRERNITSEVAINEMQFTLIRNDLVYYINEFLKDYNKVSGKNVEYVLLQDEIADKEMERQQMNMLHQGINQEKGDDKNDD